VIFMSESMYPAMGGTPLVKGDLPR
jgi:hypothetical protein